MNVSAKYFIWFRFLTPRVRVGHLSRLFSGRLFLLGFRTLVRDTSDSPFRGKSRVFNGEFDPGSGRTLAACLTHASRAVRPFGVHERRTGE